jgi:type VI secretion system protein ImpG
LREKLDDDLPELTEGLVSLLWPHYLRTIPSMSVVEFTPDWREMKEQMRIVKGFEVNSRPIGEKGTRCRYTTTKEMTLQPLSLEHARLSTDPDGRSVISLRFNCSLLPTGAVSISARSRSTSTLTHRWPAPCMKPLP